MQPNTWKYFPFPNPFSSENILHLENILHVAKHSLRAWIKYWGNFWSTIQRENEKEKDIDKSLHIPHSKY